MNFRSLKRGRYVDEIGMSTGEKGMRSVSGEMVR